MENLLSTYRCLYEKSTLWDYYKGRNHNPFDFNEIFSRTFIKEYFNEGCKEDVFQISKQFTQERITHTVSTFFLGILVRSLFPSKFEDLKPDFRYMWFLICLYHDVGYKYESNKEKYSVEKYTLKDFKKIKKIKPGNYLLNSWDPQAIPERFDLKTVMQYYEYCRKEKSFVNHGFIGGLLLYDELLKNFQDIKTKAIKEKEKSSSFRNLEEPFEYGKLKWEETDVKFYQQAAEVILAHNIWFCTKKKDEKLYEKYELSNLNIIGKPDCRIRLKNSPLLFLLALADTIEPLKSFPNIDPECLLEKIAITEIKNVLQIKILDDCLDPKSWFDKIYKMQEWLEISVKKDSDLKTLTIKLNEFNSNGKNNISC